MTAYCLFNPGFVTMHYRHAYNGPFHEEIDEPFTKLPALDATSSNDPSCTEIRKPSPPNHFGIGCGVLNFVKNVYQRIVGIGQSAVTDFIHHDSIKSACTH
ncbi:unnamed protein product [Rotaria magnacalcarata]